MSKRPSTSQPLFIFQDTIGGESFGPELKKRIDQFANVPASAWSLHKETSGLIILSAIQGGQEMMATLRKKSRGQKLVLMLDNLSLEGNIFDVKEMNIKIGQEPSMGQNLIDVLRRIIVIDHEGLDAIDGFPPRIEGQTPFSRMSSVMLSAFTAQVPEEHRNDISEITAYYQTGIKNWMIDISGYQNFSFKYEGEVAPEIRALLPSMAITSLGARENIVIVDPPHCIPERMECDPMRSLQSIAALQAFAQHYGYAGRPHS